MIFEPLIVGTAAKTFASLDDNLTRLPLMMSMTKTLRGKIAFAIGTLLANTVALVAAFFFSSLVNDVPYFHLIGAALILTLAFWSFYQKKTSVKKLGKKTVQKANPDYDRLITLVFAGFLVSFFSLVDDFIVFVPLFDGELWWNTGIVIGMYIATIIQIAVVIYSAGFLQKLPHVREVSFVALVVLALLVMAQVL